MIFADGNSSAEEHASFTNRCSRVTLAGASLARSSSPLVSLIGLLASVLLLGCAKPRAVASPSTPPRTIGPADQGAEATALLPEIVFDVTPPASTLEAMGRSVFGRHDAWLERFHGAVTFVPADVTRSHVEVDLDMTTLTMALPSFTRALRSKSFFDVEKYPRARFVSTGVEPTDKADVYRVTGTLELHGRTRSVTFVTTVVRGLSA